MNKVYSIYHLMEEKGVFEKNPANAGAVSNDGLSIYAGPVPYPKMLYHPKGEMEKVVQGIMIVDRDGNPSYDRNGEIRYTGTVWGVKYQIVENEEEETKLREAGWWTTEAEARRQSADPKVASAAPEKTKVELQAEHIAMLERRIKEMETSGPPAAKPTSGRTSSGA